MRSAAAVSVVAAALSCGGAAVAQPSPPPAPPALGAPPPGAAQPPPAYGQAPQPGYGQAPGYGQSAPPSWGPPPGSVRPPPGYGAPPGWGAWPADGRAPPGYAPGPYYYAPMMPGPSTLPYEEGQPIPPGYQLTTRPFRALIIAGGSTFLGSYAVSLLVGATALAAGGNNTTNFAPLFVPIAGPFITIGTANSSDAGTFWLAVDGVVQTAGVGLLVAGLVMDEKLLTQRPYTASTFSTFPEVLVGPRTTTLRWRF